MSASNFVNDVSARRSCRMTQPTHYRRPCLQGLHVLKSYRQRKLQLRSSGSCPFLSKRWAPRSRSASCLPSPEGTTWIWTTRLWPSTIAYWMSAMPPSASPLAADSRTPAQMTLRPGICSQHPKDSPQSVLRTRSPGSLGRVAWLLPTPADCG